MNKVFKTSACVALMALASTASAEQYWSDFSLSYLQSKDLVNPFGPNGEYDYDSNVITVEHASGHSWGSTFMFMDKLDNDDGSSDETYGEIGANISLPLLMGQDRKGQFIKDYFFAMQMEHQSQDRGFTNYLYGAGVDLAVPGASFFNVVYYRRSQDDFGIGNEDNNQITLAWRFDFAKNWRIDGFWDITTDYDNDFGEAKGSSNFTPQITYNIGPLIGMQKGRLGVGIEYSYWTDKFGAKGVDQKSTSLLAKWHF